MKVRSQRRSILSLVFLQAVLIFNIETLGQQSKQDLFQLDSGAYFKAVVQVQLWGVYSSGMKVDVDDDGTVENVTDRYNIYLRRARAGFTASPYSWLDFTMVTFFDGVGKDELSASHGPSETHPVRFGIWDAFFKAQLIRESESIYLIGGYFRPQIGRESITSAFAVNSGEKALQQTYIRQHVAATGSGRSTGINVGGLLFTNTNNFQLNYNFGVFNPITRSETTGHYSIGSPGSQIYTGRVVLNFGDPEMETYGIGYAINYQGQRKGISIGFSGAYQGQTDIFDTNYAWSSDFLLNYNNLNVDGDWHLMTRNRASPEGQISYEGVAGHFRIGYNLDFLKRTVEPVFMWQAYSGPQTLSGKLQAQELETFSGTQHAYHAGLNYYLNEDKLKLQAHYVWQTGTEGENLWNRDGNIAVRRGNYFLLGLNAVF